METYTYTKSALVIVILSGIFIFGITFKYYFDGLFANDLVLFKYLVAFELAGLAYFLISAISKKIVVDYDTLYIKSLWKTKRIYFSDIKEFSKRSHRTRYGGHKYSFLITTAQEVVIIRDAYSLSHPAVLEQTIIDKVQILKEKNIK